MDICSLMKIIYPYSLFAFFSLCLLSNNYALAEDKFANVEIKAHKLTDTTYMLTGAGGNIGASVGKDGLIIIDTQYTPLAEKISAILQEFKVGAPRYIINTHHHGDHTGGNNKFGITGTIFAHYNVLKRLASDTKYSPQGLPSMTYDNGVNIRFNGDILRIIHLGAAHTDGDSFVLWQDLSVIHMGDLFFKDKYPFIDLKAGGSVLGYRDSVSQIIQMINDDTKIIPGHGDLATRSDLIRFKQMLDTSINWMKVQLESRKTLAEIQQQGVPETLKGWDWNFISEERWIDTLYQDLN